jgi:hypothetical protein
LQFSGLVMKSPFTEILHALDAPRVPEAADRTLPSRETIRALKTTIEAALREPALLVEVIARDVEAVSAPARRTSGLVPFFTEPRTGARFALALWAPRQCAEPHEHTGWVVSAVVRNELEILTYDRHAACHDGRLVQRNTHAARAGMAGFIYEPAVHAPRNPTDVPTLSLHVVGPHDNEQPLDGRSYDLSARTQVGRKHPFGRCLAHRQTQRYLRAQSAAVRDARDARVGPLLERMIELGNSRTRQVILDDLATVDPARARAQVRRHAARRLTARTVLEVPPGLTIQRTVIIADGRARLVASAARTQVVLLELDAAAHAALDRLTSDEPLVVGDLPGGLAMAERIATLEALDEWGLLRISQAGAGGGAA